MATLTEYPVATDWTAADLVDRFGAIPLRRLRHDPPLGMATEDDVVAIREQERRLYELVEGVLVEKTMGVQESFLAALIIKLLGYYLDQADLGIVLGADGMARLSPGLIRIPDVSFIAWERLPGRRVPATPWVAFAPDLAVEVISPSNTAKEMSRKLLDYFEAGVALVWYVDPATRTVEVYTAPDRVTTLRDGDTLDGGAVLPGFAAPVASLFAGLGPEPAKAG